jgi:hypothetical protein
MIRDAANGRFVRIMNNKESRRGSAGPEIVRELAGERNLVFVERFAIELLHGFSHDVGHIVGFDSRVAADSATQVPI